MARHEADREDLFAEAVAFTRRLEGRIDDGPLIVAGFRTGGLLSIYFGADPMYQLDDLGRLRRALEHGFLYRTQGDTLARLTRTRTDSDTTLLRHDLTPGELAAFQRRMGDRLADLLNALDQRRLQRLRQVPVDDIALESDIATRLRTALDADSWLAPSIPTRRI